jgi:cytochrome c oxidase subunit 2
VTAKWTTLVPILSVVAAALLGVACGKEREPQGPMSEGQRVMLASGCTACHGPDGEGGVGPSWKGLYQSQITLADGSKVVADDAYLAEAIRDPSAKQVKGYGPMPPNSLDDTEVQAVVDFIKSLAK